VSGEQAENPCRAILETFVDPERMDDLSREIKDFSSDSEGLNIFSEVPVRTMPVRTMPVRTMQKDKDIVLDLFLLNLPSESSHLSESLFCERLFLIDPLIPLSILSAGAISGAIFQKGKTNKHDSSWNCWNRFHGDGALPDLSKTTWS